MSNIYIYRERERERFRKKRIFPCVIIISYPLYNNQTQFLKNYN